MPITTEDLIELIKDDSGDSNLLDYLDELEESPSSSVNYAVEYDGKNVFDRILLDVEFGSIDDTEYKELSKIITFFRLKGVIKAKMHHKIKSSDYADARYFLKLLKSINPERSRSRSRSKSRGRSRSRSPKSARTTRRA